MNKDVESLMKMTKEKLKVKILSSNLNDEEKEAFDKGKNMVDKMCYMGNDKSRKKVSLDLIAYTIYKLKGGK